ncbi:TIM-barrel domain-containing protein [Youngiibacter multivorans]|uniref:Alpha-glucosidase n=1 Tax=Youngiibacter multivorans TaxID=937251 RepID=A0ABS4G1I9_9CLOT|nr:TIM-barrel domain-containing protein [Youngiibacter multivorans]MBP1918405.1 alpha-glucosidase [Youngiibacter multivorans]
MKAFDIAEGIRVLVYGEPMDTGAVVCRLGNEIEADGFGHVELLGPDASRITMELKKKDIVYGLGANLGGINKRGRKYESYCTDEPVHSEEKKRLYAAHNFLMISGNGAKGFFIDFPGLIGYDIGCSDKDKLIIDVAGEDFAVYEIDGKNEDEVVQRFHSIIGRSYVPPKWGLGYFQSRWGYETSKDVRRVKKSFDDLGIPLEGIYLDLDYMEDFKDFSVSDERFPDMEELVREFKEDGVYIIPIIDAGVKIEKGYDIYEEGILNDHFVKTEAGKPYVAAVWPGKVHLPDFLRPETRKWWGEKYKVLTDLGIEGYWNDMNEPAIFYDEEELEKAVDAAIASKGANLGVLKYFELKDLFKDMGNRERYYRTFYHEVDGKVVVNEKVHNLYGQNMTVAAGEGLRSILGKRHVLISRASSTGMHRHSGIWTGDNSSWWSHLELNIRMMPSINMAGFYYVGADTGGFGNSTNWELLTRWLQFSAFTPLYRNHSAIGNDFQEPYIFGDEVTGWNREIIKARYALIPYLYSEMMKSVMNGTMMFRPLSFMFRDDASKDTEDQLLLGKELMLTPVTKPNASGRTVYLPEDMAEVTFRDGEVSLERTASGLRRLEYGFDCLKFYLRKDSILPYSSPSMNVRSLDIGTLHAIAYVDKEAEYVLYDDDGESYGYETGESWSTTIKVRRDGLDFSAEAISDNPKIEKIVVDILGTDGDRIRKTITI